ncbi:MAG: NAD-dependent dehydratase, partial [Actinomycetota bacterium]
VYEMATALGRGFEAVAPPRITGRWRLGDVRHVFASARRALDLLAWRAEVDFDRGMRSLAVDRAPISS